MRNSDRTCHNIAMLTGSLCTSSARAGPASRRAPASLPSPPPAPHTLAAARWHPRLRPPAGLPDFLDGGGKGQEAAAAAQAQDPDTYSHHEDDHPLQEQPAPQAQVEQAAAAQVEQAGEHAALKDDVEMLKQLVEQLQAEMGALNDRARERAVSLAQAVREASDSGSGGDGGVDAMQALQQQQDSQLQEDEKSWDKLMDTFTAVMSKGYIQSVEKIRDRLLITEWELSRKGVAARKGVSQFELHCASQHVALPFEVITQLYEQPDNLEVVEDPHLRMHARACIRGAVDEEYGKVWSHCTQEAQKLAQQFSNTEFISKLIPESGVLDALKKVLPVALKMVV